MTKSTLADIAIARPSTRLVANFSADIKDCYEKLVSLAKAAKWEDLRRQAHKSLGIAHEYFLVTSSELTNENTRNGVTAKLATDFIDQLKDQAQNKNTRQEYFANILRDLQTKNPEVYQDCKESLERLQQGKTTNIDLFDSMKDVTKPQEATLSDIVADQIMGLVAKSLIALECAEFNLAFNNTTEPTDGAVQELTASLKRQTASTKRTLKNKQNAIYKQCKAKNNQKIWNASLDLISTIKEQLAPSVRLQASLRKSIDSPTKDAALKPAGKALADAGNLTRDIITSIVSSHCVAYEVNKPILTDHGKLVITKASTKEFDKPLDDGKVTSFAALPQTPNGKLVQIEGFVTNITIYRSEGYKLVSKIELSNASNKQEKVTAVALFVNAIHIGISAGSYCVVHGWNKKSSVLNKNQPAVEVDKLAISELSKTSWKIAFLDAADIYIERYRSGLFMEWSLSPYKQYISSDGQDYEGIGETLTPFLIIA